MEKRYLSTEEIRRVKKEVEASKKLSPFERLHVSALISQWGRELAYAGRRAMHPTWTDKEIYADIRRVEVECESHGRRRY